MVMVTGTNNLLGFGKTEDSYVPGSYEPGTERAVERPYDEVDRIQEKTIIGSTGWNVALDMGVDIRYSDNGVSAINTWIDEYGYGATKQEAVEDLLISLVDFRESLERQAQISTLADELQAKLDHLRLLLNKVN